MNGSRKQEPEHHSGITIVATGSSGPGKYFSSWNSERSTTPDAGCNSRRRDWRSRVEVRRERPRHDDTSDVKIAAIINRVLDRMPREELESRILTAA